MKGNFERAMPRELVYEGGYSNNPKDPGGSTMKGVTQGTYNSWRLRQGLPTRDVRTITNDELMAIYKGDYWDRIHGDELPSGVDFAMFDAAVNSGVGGATKWAQVVCALTADGDMGPKTLTAIMEDDPEDFVRSFCAHRLGTLQRLPTWGDFGKGWAARITNVQKIALAWTASEDGPDPVQVHTIGGHIKAKPTDVPQSKLSQIATHATVAGGVVVTGAAQAGQALAPASDALAWVKYVVAGVTVLSAVAGVVVFIGQRANDLANTGSRTATVDPDADTAAPAVKVVTPASVVSVTAQVTGGKVG